MSEYKKFELYETPGVTKESVFRAITRSGHITRNELELYVKKYGDNTEYYAYDHLINMYSSTKQLSED
jgi:hypothetical protein